MYFFSATLVLKLKLFFPRPSYLLMRCITCISAKIRSYLNSSESAMCQIASLSHHPVTHVSTLPVSQLACQVSHDPLLLCCCFVLREFRTAGDEMQSHGFFVALVGCEKEHKHVLIAP